MNRTDEVRLCIQGEWKTIDEIADVLGISTGSAHTYLAKLKKRIHVQMKMLGTKKRGDIYQYRINKPKHVKSEDVVN